ncbi:MAG: hypothetical protein GEU74_13180 [Nitriliruptorales bacterium]|nr:hypothetical protein [Nitriliruptorales bacterium]
MGTVEPLVVDLDDQRSGDPAVAGAKAATLARARTLGFPVLDGVVVPSAAGMPSVRAGVKALTATGSGGARLAVMAIEVDDDLADELRRSVERLGAPVVVRSSSPIENSGDFAGAFSSFDGIGPDEVGTAVRGVWASPFGVDALARCESAGVPVDDVAPAVLIQPEITPLFGGSAKVRTDGAVEVVATRGAPQKLMNGWDSGSVAVARVGEQPSGAAVELLGVPAFSAVVALARSVADGLGDNLVEWAWTVDGVVLLQARRAAEAPAPVEPPPALPVFREPAARRVAATVRRFPGALGESLVLPWALCDTNLPVSFPLEPVDDLLGVLDEARSLGAELASQAWGLPPNAAAAAAAELYRDLRGPDPRGAMAWLDRLAPVDPIAAARAAWLVETLVESATRLGYVEVPSQVWDLPAERLERVLEGTDATSLPVRSPADRWEPFVYGVVAAQGRSVTGVPVTDGVGAGRVVVVDDPESVGDVNRAIIVARRPIPALSSLLWRVAGLVTVAGSTAAHLFEVASSVGVPAVISVDFDEVIAGGIDELARRHLVGAIDGTTGRLWLLEEQ